MKSCGINQVSALYFGPIVLSVLILVVGGNVGLLEAQFLSNQVRLDYSNGPAGAEAALIELRPATDATGPISIEPGATQVGSRCSVALKLLADIESAFDFYLLADTQFGPFTLFLNGGIQGGIMPLFRNVPGYSAPFEAVVTPGVALPAAMGGKQITFYAVAVEAGTIPPVSLLSQLEATTPNVITMYKEVSTVSQ